MSNKNDAFYLGGFGPAQQETILGSFEKDSLRNLEGALNLKTPDEWFRSALSKEIFKYIQEIKRGPVDLGVVNPLLRIMATGAKKLYSVLEPSLRDPTHRDAALRMATAMGKLPSTSGPNEFSKNFSVFVEQLRCMQTALPLALSRTKGGVTADPSVSGLAVRIITLYECTGQTLKGITHDNYSARRFKGKLVELFTVAEAVGAKLVGRAPMKNDRIGKLLLTIRNDPHTIEWVEKLRNRRK